MTRTIEVPDGCKAIIVTDQLVARFADWKALDEIEARAVPLDDLTVDVQTRYVAPEYVTVRYASE